MDTHRTHGSHGLVPGHRVRVGKEPTRVGVPASENGAEPQIVLVRDGDVIRAIEVVCTCGKRIRMNCVF